MMERRVHSTSGGGSGGGGRITLNSQVEIKTEFDGLQPSAFSASSSVEIGHSVQVQVMDRQDDAVELNNLRRELEHCKLQTQLLLQTKKLLEDRLNQVTREFEEYKNSVRLQICLNCGEDLSGQYADGKALFDSGDGLFTSNTGSSHYLNINSSAAANTPPPDFLFIKKHRSDSSPALQSALENITYGVTEEYRRSSLFGDSSPVQLIPMLPPLLLSNDQKRSSSVSSISDAKSKFSWSTSSHGARPSFARQASRSLSPAVFQADAPQVYKLDDIMAFQQDRHESLSSMGRADSISSGRNDSVSSSGGGHESVSSIGKPEQHSSRRQESSLSSISSSRSSLSVSSSVPVSLAPPSLPALIRSPSGAAAVATMALKSQSGGGGAATSGEAGVGSPASAAAESSCSPVSTELCMHFLKGRCRYKRQCKFSHDVMVCPYCNIDLPEAKIAASTHLSRCYKINVKGASAVASGVDLDPDDEADALELASTN
eukprot:TRINITY_DN79455_c0_g1_i1.p1 TRINITY_DN79455_c0_g1~~TRINITY_DN79455_c0_g1_i1.p1  ORF type:complete len:487 (-),score=82.94 TRINITY_DN79455_c0_g1_i1:66-1526(-)